MQNVAQQSGYPFVVIIDEWDCLFREYRNDQDAQELYLDFLRDSLKDNSAIALAYMTGILPIKKYGTHSALNMFDEFSMTEPKALAKYVGFTDEEVHILCKKYDMDYEEVAAWYNGYHFDEGLAIYSPQSVVSAMLHHLISNYWNRTETYEALKLYIEMNLDGLKDAVVEMIAGGRIKIDIRFFGNDMVSFANYNDVLTLLVHLGYLGYDFNAKEVYIPNKEIMEEFVTSITAIGWNEVVNAIKASDELLTNTWNKNAYAVAAGIEAAHMETSHLTYSDENALAYTVALAYYGAKEYYTFVRELPTGKGFADMVFIPRFAHSDKPAMIIELKWDKSARTAIDQIKEKLYVKSLDGYKGTILLVGINYNKKTKEHECIIESALRE
jgi:hypothetical protein